MVGAEHEDQKMLAARQAGKWGWLTAGLPTDVLFPTRWCLLKQLVAHWMLSLLPQTYCNKLGTALQHGMQCLPLGGCSLGGLHQVSEVQGPP